MAMTNYLNGGTLVGLSLGPQWVLWIFPRVEEIMYCGCAAQVGC